MSERLLYLYGGTALVAAVALMWFMSRDSDGSGQSWSEKLGGAAVNAVDGLASGAVKAAGEMVGIPDTNMSECERAIAEGRTWDASFVCPAKRFLSHVFSSDPMAAATPPPFNPSATLEVPGGAGGAW